MSDAILRLEKLYKRFGNRVSADDFSLSISAGEFFTLLGPSGSGKSTVLRMIAGLESPDAGKVFVRGHDVTSTAPWYRNIGMVFQHYANFPHLNVAQNIAYGLRRSMPDKSLVRQRVDELLALVGMEGFASRRVTELSGGEQQRIAIARALAPGPAILLLDEPLSALDEKIRREMQEELRRIQQTTETTFVYVTHDQEEALTMSDRIAVLNLGRCVQCDAPDEIFQRPRTPFVARFFRGSNVLRADVQPAADGRSQLRIAGARWQLDVHVPGATHVAVRSEAIRLGDQAGQADVQLSARLESISYRGIYTACQLRLDDDQPLLVATLEKLDSPIGATMRIGLDSKDLVVLEND